MPLPAAAFSVGVDTLDDFLGFGIVFGLFGVARAACSSSVEWVGNHKAEQLSDGRQSTSSQQEKCEGETRVSGCFLCVGYTLRSAVTPTS